MNAHHNDDDQSQNQVSTIVSTFKRELVNTKYVGYYKKASGVTRAKKKTESVQHSVSHEIYYCEKRELGPNMFTYVEVPFHLLHLPVLAGANMGRRFEKTLTTAGKCSSSEKKEDASDGRLNGDIRL